MYSDIGFIIGVVLIGLACARNKKINTDQMNKNIQTMNDARMGMVCTWLAYSDDSTRPINTDQMNKNIQTMNDALWGKPEKKEDKKITNITLYHMTLHEREKKP